MQADSNRLIHQLPHLQARVEVGADILPEQEEGAVVEVLIVVMEEDPMAMAGVEEGMAVVDMVVEEIDAAHRRAVMDIRPRRIVAGLIVEEVVAAAVDMAVIDVVRKEGS